MGRKAKKEEFEGEIKLGLKNYFKLIKLSFLHPNIYALRVFEDSSLKKAVLTLVINCAVVIFLQIIYRSLYQRNLALFFAATSEVIFILPIMVLFSVILGVVLFLIGKVLGGRGKIEQILKSCFYSSLPLIFLPIPVVGFFSLAWFMSLLILTFQLENRYSYGKAIINILLPFLVLVVMATVIGLIKINFV